MTKRRRDFFVGTETGDIVEYNIVTTEDLSLSARSECLVKGIREGQKSCGMPGADFLFSKGILVAKALVDVSKDYIPVANISDRPKIIHKGEQCASCSAVTSKMRGCPEDSSPDDLNTILRNLNRIRSAEQEACKCLIFEFSAILSTALKDMRCTGLTEHRINTGHQFPFKQASRKLPLTKKEVDSHLKICRKSTSSNHRQALGSRQSSY